MGHFFRECCDFKNYMGFHQHRYLAFLYLGILLYLWFAEKDRHRRAVFVYAPTLLLVMFFCPLFRKLFVRLLDDSETYYRLLWLLQMSLVSAYGVIRLCAVHRRIGTALACLLILFGGDYVYDSEHISKAENAYHLPQETVDIAGMIEPQEGRITVLVPADLIYYIRQYSSNIELPYGREMLISRWAYHHPMYEAMEEAEVIETETFVELAREYPCAYIILKEDRETTEPLTAYGYEVYGQVDEFVIYRDLETGME